MVEGPRQAHGSRELLYFLAWRDLKVRFKQAHLGVAWVVVQPRLTMAIFSVIFGRFGKLPSEGVPYLLFCFAALLPWQLFSTALQRSSLSLVSSANLLTKVYFPRLVIPLAAVRGEEPSAVDGAAGRRVVELVQRMYGEAKRLDLPWLRLTGEPVPGVDAAGVAETGASGFIGGRIVERLCLDGAAPPRALVRTESKVALIACFPAERALIDWADPASLTAALRGCEVVVHCAFDFSEPPDQMILTNLAMLENLLAARGYKILYQPAAVVSHYTDPERVRAGYFLRQAWRNGIAYVIQGNARRGRDRHLAPSPQVRRRGAAERQAPCAL